MTSRGPADWHPANREQREVFARAAAFCEERGEDISKVALQFSSQHPDIPTTMFTSANPDSVKRNVEWHEQPVDPAMVERVREILAPVLDLQWTY